VLCDVRDLASFPRDEEPFDNVEAMILVRASARRDRDALDRHAIRRRGSGPSPTCRAVRSRVPGADVAARLMRG
jgi:hypothetical protein